MIGYIGHHEVKISIQKDDFKDGVRNRSFLKTLHLFKQAQKVQLFNLHNIITTTGIQQEMGYCSLKNFI